jgi:hypothetical protein
MRLAVPLGAGLAIAGCAPDTFSTAAVNADGGSPDTASRVTPHPERPIVLGDLTLCAGSDPNDLGMAEAYAFKATRTGAVIELGIYVAAETTAPRLQMGLYEDSADNVGAMLALTSQQDVAVNG